MGRDLRALGRTRLGWILGAAALLLLLYLAWPSGQRAGPIVAGSASATPAQPSITGAPMPTVDPTAAWKAMGGVASVEADGAVKSLAQLRIEHAQHTLDTYLAWARYPPESRPLSEHPDRQTTDYGSSDKHFFVRKNGVKRTDVWLKKTQSHAFLVAEESVKLQISCENQGQVLPCAISGAEASAVPVVPGVAPVAVRFTDDGKDGDEVAGDHVFTAMFQPGTSSLAGKDARIGVAVWLRYQEDEGQAFYQFEYTAAEPARFTGKVTEAIESGSLALYLEFDVRNAGRYSLTARVDDGAGVGFGYLPFNGELAAGLVKVRFVLFGKLIKDQKASAPFKLRDLNGLLLKENTHPDREVIRDTKGVFYTTKAYAESEFSDAEWDSAEKKRHVAEFQKDLEAAKAGGPVPPGTPAPP